MRLSKRHYAQKPALFFAFALSLFWVQPTLAQPAFTDGTDVLFAGHSFFIPIANEFNTMAIENGFSQHNMETHFHGGQNGSPGFLWDDADGSRTAIQNILATGNVKLFGLTAYSDEDSAYEDYVLWFDLALSYNPDTAVFIGMPWVPGGTEMETAVFDQMIEERGESLFQIVTALRQTYPNNPIHFINYGKTASAMKHLFETDRLPDIDDLVGQHARALFTDNNLGHAGIMMKQLCALSWMEILYGGDVTELSFPSYESNVRGIVNYVVNYNEPYQALPIEFAPGSLNVARGNLVLGGVSDLSLSDNSDVSVQRSRTDLTGVVEIECSGFSPYLNPESITMTIESAGFFRTEILQSVSLWDYENETWVDLGSNALSRFVDSESPITISENASDFVNQETREVLARVSYSTAVARQLYSVGIDKLIWTVE